MNLRNKPCSCGSGKKYKKCCGDEAALNAKRQEERKKEKEAFLQRMAQRRAQQRKIEDVFNNASHASLPPDPWESRSPYSAAAVIFTAMSMSLGGGLFGCNASSRSRRKKF